MLKLTFIADTHHYSKTLGTDGRQYELRSGSDQKCLAETGDIIDAAFEKIANSDTDAVLIAGDVSNDGERVSHAEFREKLYRLKEKKRVYLITATHDWCCDQNPRRFEGDKVYNDVPVMSSRELPEFYNDFGFGEALSKFTTHIGTCSYVVQLSDNVRLLALNDDKNANNHAGFTEEHFQWIEEQLAQAEKDNCLVIGMEHHLLMPHISSLITGGGTCVEDREYVASRLADAGLKYMFVGHSHIQSTADFKTDRGNVLKEINIGSLVGYPAPMVNVTVNDDMTLSYRVEHLESFCIDGKSIDAQEYLKNHALDLIRRVLDAENEQEFSERLTALQLNGGKISRFYHAIKPVISFVKNGTAGELYKKLKFTGLARGIDSRALMPYYNTKIMTFVENTVLSVFDGSVKAYDRNSDYYRLVMSFVSIPSKILKKNSDMKRLIFAMDSILTGGKYNNQQDTI
ncbi:MAG: metallophosphoesterase family protein [Eubacterium sp.]